MPQWVRLVATAGSLPRQGQSQSPTRTSLPFSLTLLFLYPFDVSLPLQT
jgi:hypothetical protein